MDNSCCLWFKRCIDIIGSIVGLVIFAPIMGVIVILQSMIMGRPILFIQERAGKGGKPFNLYKFRSMRGRCVRAGDDEEDKKRLSKWGEFLRNSSLDELPQFWNVLKGDMSLVGPRPLLCMHNYKYDENGPSRLRVKPGITGWAQINGRNGISGEERLEKDLWYIDNFSLKLDLKILFKTLVVVLRREGT